MEVSHVILCPCSESEGAAELQQRLAECGGRRTRPFHLVPGVAAELTVDELHRFLERNPGALVLPDRRRQIPPRPFRPDDWAEARGPRESPVGSPSAPALSPLALTQTGADQIQALGYDGAGLRICVIDSGVDFSHPDLRGTAILGPDGQPLAADFTETDLTDTVGHGTAVAGCIAAQGREVHPVRDEQTEQIIAYTRIRGIAPGARLMSAKVFDARKASGYDSAIIAALEWAAEQGAQIINMSLGGLAIPNDGSDPLAAAVAAVRDRGILVVVSAGNEGGGRGTLSTPGSSRGALTAGASTTFRSFAQMGFLAEGDRWTADQLAAFSSLGPAGDGRPKPDLLAPGAFDWGLAPMTPSEAGQQVQLFGGTSQAAPFLTGCAALLYQAFHRRNGRYPAPEEATQLLSAAAEDLGLPAHMQGAGRVNILRAVQAALGASPALTAAVPEPAVAAPGEEGRTALILSNRGTAPAMPAVAASCFRPLAAEISVISEITAAQPAQEVPFQVEPETALLHLSLTWPTEEHGRTTPRLLLALYDPEGRLANYQRPSGAGDYELGKSVDAWVARPAPGRWVARVQLREAPRNVLQPFTLLVMPYQRSSWSWINVEGALDTLAPGESRSLTARVRVPEDAAPGTHLGHLHVGAAIVPLSVIVPVPLAKGQGRFAGTFLHGYQGSWGNGDWIYHHLAVPPGTRSLAANIQWPDVDNAVEFYLIDPAGRPVMGKSNTEDVVDDGDSDALTSQLLLAEPKPGMWRLLAHSFAFSGRGRPEPYFGVISTGEELVSPRQVELRIRSGEPAPLALVVRNPGRAALTVCAVAQADHPELTWQAVAGRLPGEGDGDAHLAAVRVPHGARLVGAVLRCRESAEPLALTLLDPVSRSGRVTATGPLGSATVMEAAPVPGEWVLKAALATPDGDGRQVAVEGALFTLAPRPLAEAETDWLTVQPGAEAVVPVRLRLPLDSAELAGMLVVTTAEGDHLGSVPFRISLAPSAPDGVPVATPTVP